MVYPDDANGDVLRRMEAAGDDLARPREVDLNVVFPTENVAEQFANHFSALGFAASVEFGKVVQDLPWEVVVKKHMVPSHSEVGSFEEVLERIANPLGGCNDEWGCFSEHPPSTDQRA
jgi:hypothetical protein